MTPDYRALTSVQCIMLGTKGEKRRRKLNDKKGHTGLETFQKVTNTCTRQKFDSATSRYEKNVHLGTVN
jgi:hypothetical protein